MKGAIIMWESLKMGFYQTFILEDNHQYFVKGLGTTLTVTIFALIIGVIIGVLVAIIRSAHDQQPERKKGLPLKILNGICKVYLTVIRGTPMMVQLLIMWFVVWASAGSTDSNMMKCAILAFGIAAFVLPHGMITGGATGLGLVTSRAFGVDLSVAVAVYNIILFAVGAFVLGKKFALTTIVSTIVYPMFLSFFTQRQWIATMTNDILLSAIYAGIMVGLGVGIVIRFGASTGGLDIPPLILNKKFGIPVAVSMYLFDFTVLLLQIVISTKEQVLYGILIVILSSIVLGYVSLAGQKKVQVMIISRHYQEIRDMLLQKLDLGATMYHIETGYLQKDEMAVCCVISSRKLHAVTEMVQEVDKKAFLSVTQINEVRGRGFTLDRKYISDGR